MQQNNMKQDILLRLLPCLYLAASLPVFYKVYRTTKTVIDEEFHLRQGRHYCNGNFHVWDSKITTLPGLYLASSLLRPFQMCTTFYLRMTSLLASTANVLIILKIRTRADPKDGWLLALDAINVAILPPMYFFSHLYYTDILSMTTVLAMFFFWMQGCHFRASVYSVASVLMRQTNIVWVVMVLGISAIEEVLRNYAERKKLRRSDVDLFSLKTLKSILANTQILFESVTIVLSKFHVYISVILAFAVFVVMNGSIVVGDKTAHTASIHIPQIFYFTLFTLLFGVSILITNFSRTLHLLRQHWTLALALIVFSAIVVHFNTLVHPYLLADNRHYTFYIWNRLYGRYEWFRFGAIPAYVFGLFLIAAALEHKSQSFKLMFWVCTCAVLVPQKMIEVRYFLIPFVVLRMHLKGVSKFALLAEFAVYLAVNLVTFYVFFTKEIYWNDFIDAQRLIW